MPTPSELLALKNQEPTHLPANEANKVGGPTPFDTTAYIDAAFGINPDTTIAPKAVVGQEPMKKIEEKPEPKASAAPQTDTPGEDGAEESEEDKMGVVTESSDDDIEIDLSDLDKKDDDDEKKDDLKEETVGQEDTHLDDFVAKFGDDAVPNSEIQDIKESDGDDDEDDQDDDDLFEENDEDEDKDKKIEESRGRGNKKLVVEDENPFAKKDDDEKDDSSDDSDDSDDDSKDDDKSDDDDSENKGIKKIVVKEATLNCPDCSANPCKCAMTEQKVRIKLALTEESQTLLANDTTLTEAQKNQIRRLFESAVKTAVRNVLPQINNAYRKAYQNRAQLAEARSVRQLDAYLAYVAEQWFNKHKPVIKNNVRAELAENLLAGMKTLFVENYIDVPTSKINVVKKLSEEVKQLNNKLRASEQNAFKAHQALQEQMQKANQTLLREHKKRLILEEAQRLPLSERGKFAQRANAIRFTKTSTFKSDLTVLRESWDIPANRTKRTATEIPAEATTVLNEDVKQRKDTQTSANVRPYTDALDRMAGQK